MFLYVILGAVALLAGASATVMALLILGIRRGDRGKRLTGQPRSRTEMLSQRVLTVRAAAIPATTRRASEQDD